MTKYCGRCGAENKPQVDHTGRQLNHVFHVWWQSPELSQRITAFAVCGCGVHTDMKADTLICRKCKALGIKASADAEPGRFPVMALYEKNESWTPAGADDVYGCLGAPMCWCRKNPCVCVDEPALSIADEPEREGRE